MSKLPKIVRDRLAQPAAGPHPDPDLLTAFSEHALGAREREQVLAHLAACAGCREVVSLATPPLESAPDIALAPARAWFSWGYMRWSGAVAAILLVAAVAIMFQPQLRSPMDTRPRTDAEAQRAVESAPGSRFETKSDEAKDLQAKMEARNAQRHELRTDRLAKAVPPDEGSAGKVGALASARGAGAGAAAPVVAPPPPASVMADAAKDQAAPSGLKREKDAKSNEFALQTPAAPAAKPAPEPVVAQRQPAEGEQLQMRDQATTAAAAEEESRSADLGRRREMAKATNTVAMGMAGKAPSNWRVSASGALERLSDRKWSEALSVAGVNFTTVAVLGNHVWAGGKQGVVYVSDDHGRRWVRRQLPVEQAVTAIEVLGAKRARVSTAAAVYTTADSGATWSEMPAEQ